MIDQLRFQEMLGKYKRFSVESGWRMEKYKWVAIKCFQDYWEINASDFADMLKRSLSKTYNFLASMNNFPGRMIQEFAQGFPEDVRAMFINLFDETQDTYDRIAAFKAKAVLGPFMGASKSLKRLKILNF